MKLLPSLASSWTLARIQDPKAGPCTPLLHPDLLHLLSGTFSSAKALALTLSKSQMASSATSEGLESVVTCLV